MMRFQLILRSWFTLSFIIMVTQGAFAASPSPEDGFNAGGSANVCICVQHDGKILIPNESGRLVRFNADGSLDGSFNSQNSGFSKAIVVQPDGKIIVGGKIGTSSVITVARLNPDGSYDSSFKTVTSSSFLTSGVKHLALQPDGKILISGEFMVGNDWFILARLNSDGSLDTSFKHSLPSMTQIEDIALQSDGKIIVGCYNQSVLWRLNPNGSIDSTFHPAFNTNNAVAVHKVFLQPDGRILVNGNLNRDNQNSYHVARLNRDGTLDSSFQVEADEYGLMGLQPDGKILLRESWTENGVAHYVLRRRYPNGPVDPLYWFELVDDVRGFAIQPDGKVVMSYPLFTPNKGLFRLNLDGSLDKDFDFGLNTNHTIRAMARQGDGKTVIGGEFDSICGIPRKRIARLNADNTLDLSFDPGAGANGSVTGVGIQPGGKVVIIGEFTSVAGTARGGIARLNANGSLDTGFNPQVNGGISQIEMRPDGKFLLLGSFSSINGITRASLARLNQDGSVDSAFDPGPTNGTRSCMIVQPDEKVLIGGAMHAQIGTLAMLTRLNPNGAADSSFRSSHISGYTDVSHVTMLQDGKILAVGYAPATTSTLYSRNAIRCYDSDGTTNSAYQCGDTEIEGTIQSVAQQDDKLLIGGDFDLSSKSSSPYSGPVSGEFLVCLKSDGVLDGSYKGNSAANERVRAIEVLPDGNVLLAGDFTEYNGTPRNHFARINPDGSLNTTASLVVSAPDGEVNAVATGSDASLTIGGKFGSIYQLARPGAARLSAGGDLISTFSTNLHEVSVIAALPDGKALTCDRPTTASATHVITRRKADGTIDSAFSQVSVDARVDCMSVQPDGSVVIAGGFHHVKGLVRNQIARIGANGALDMTFNAGDGVDLGEIVDPDDGSDENHDWIYHQSRGSLSSIAVQADGRIIIAGRFDRAAGVDHKNVARLSPSGVLDTSFDPGSGTDGQVFAVVMQPDGKALIAGEFLIVNGKTRNGIARLNPDGSLDESFVPETTELNYFHSLCLQSDGKILAAGFYSSNKGYGRVARLNADGSFDALFETPEPLSFAFAGVDAIALQCDGKLLAGGKFEQFGQTARRNFARISNPDGALQSLAVAPGGAGVTWRLGGSYPQPYQALFEESADGVNWSVLGWGTPVPGVGFAMPYLRLPILTPRYVRATGWSTGGLNNGSVSIHRSTLYYFSGSYNGALDWGLYN